MLVHSLIKPQRIEIQYIKTKIAHIKLRKNIKDIIKKNNDENVMYEYDEVVFDIENTNNLIKYIEENFDLYFNYGLQQMELKQSKEKAEKQIYNLINQHKLVDLNNNTENASMLLTLLMSEIDSLKNEIKFLKEKVGV
ncbi:TPA: hypothetical protein ACXDAZ_002478 [Clostridium botulinum]